jgi:hypothetical protein
MDNSKVIAFKLPSTEQGQSLEDEIAELKKSCSVLCDYLQYYRKRVLISHEILEIEDFEKLDRIMDFVLKVQGKRLYQDVGLMTMHFEPIEGKKVIK